MLALCQHNWCCCYYYWYSRLLSQKAIPGFLPIIPTVCKISCPILDIINLSICQFDDQKMVFVLICISLFWGWTPFSYYWPLRFHLLFVYLRFNFFLLISSICSYISDIKMSYSCKHFLPISHCFSNLFSNIVYGFFCSK